MDQENKGAETYKQPEQKKSPKKFIISCVCVLVLVVAAGGIAGYLNSDAFQTSKQIDLGRKYLDELKYEQALAEFEKAIEIDPKIVDAYIGMADAYAGMGDLVKAVEILNQGYEETGDEMLSEAIAAVIEKQIELARSHTLEKNYAQATQVFQEVLQIDPENVEAYLGMAEMYLDMENTNTAIWTLREGHQRTNDKKLMDAIDSIISEYLALAQKYLDEGDYAQALTEFQRVCGIDAGCADAYLGMAASYEGQGDVKQSVLTLENGYKKTQDERFQDALARYKLQCEDKQLEAMLEQALGKLSGNVYVSDVENMQRLQIIGSGEVVEEKSEWRYVWITGSGRPENTKENAPFGLAAYPCDGERAAEYAGAGYEAVEVKTRIYGEGTIQTLSGIENLTELTTLEITQNNISDISALGNLTKLTYINLDQNNISDISALDGLVNLDSLSLGDNHIKDISVLGSLTGLTFLNLSGNEINDISVLESLTRLEFIAMWDNEICSIKSLDDLDKLENLCTALNRLPNLQIVYLDEESDNDIGLLRLSEFRQSDQEALHDAIAAEPSNVWAYFALAEKYVQAGDSAAAVQILQQGCEVTFDKRLERVAESIL